MSHRIVFLDRATIAPQIRVRPPSFAHELIEHAETRADQVVERLAGASIAITNKAPITAATLERLPALKLVAVAATGTDCVDKAACAARGVLVSNIRGYAINTVPEHAFALILALRRNVVAYRESVLAGRWQQSGQFCFFDHPIRDLSGSRLGIIGEGVLGQRVAELGKAFGMQPMFAAHKGRSGLGPLYTPWQGGDRDERRHLAALAADERDARHDRHARVRGDEAQAADRQHRAWRPGRRSRAGARARRGIDLGRRLRRGRW
jgi:glycerate dehydrogenase